MNWRAEFRERSFSVTVPTTRLATPMSAPPAMRPDELAVGVARRRALFGASPLAPTERGIARHHTQDAARGIGEPFERGWILLRQVVAAGRASVGWTNTTALRRFNSSNTG